MSNAGMSEQMFEFISSNLNRLTIDIEKGIITTPRGTNGTICSSTGYLRVKVNKKTLQVHQLLAVAYYGKSCVNMQVNHKDGDKLNNKKDNLELVTLQDNVRHAWKNNLASNKHSRKLTDEQVSYIRNNHVPNRRRGEYTVKYFMDEFNVSRHTIKQVLRNERYIDKGSLA